MMGFLQVERARRYLEALEEEKKKIQVFRRELPLCCDLVAQAIASYRQQMVCDEDTSSDVPVLEEFIPIKRSSSLEEEEGEEEEEESSKDVKSSGCGDEEQHHEDKKPDWLQSVQLWNQNPDPPKEEAKTQKPIALEAKKVKGAFHPFHREQKNTVPVAEPPPPPPPPPPPAAASSTGDTAGSGGGGHEKEGHSNRKARRCWSPELHRRFLHALQQLGGSHVATPKQIRELMKVDGLTNDEVKSHLQKYRLHTRRPNPSAPMCSGGSTQTPQFILVGGIWVPPPPPPPPEYTVAAAMSQPVTENSAAATSRIYAPVASVPMGSKCGNNNKNSNNNSNNSGDGDQANSNSPATSSSSLTVTASPCL